ncbi:MAG: helix-turn-helix domain-containing protein, partial [Nocardioides sp.]
MDTQAPMTFGQRVSAMRLQRGMSQRQLAAELNRSESWVSQVERDALRVHRLPVLRALADTLGVPLTDLAPEPVTEGRGRSDLDQLRLVMTGHPVPDLLLASEREPTPARLLERLRAEVDRAWESTHRSDFRSLSDCLSELIPTLELYGRTAAPRRRGQIQDLLASAYQAAAAAFARVDDADASWVAADRAVSAGERGTDPLSALAAHFRMAHAFITLNRLDQAEFACRRGIDTLATLTHSATAPMPVLSIYGALQLALALTYAKAARRDEAHAALEEAAVVARRIPEVRNDYGTEFGVANV